MAMQSQAKTNDVTEAFRQAAQIESDTPIGTLATIEVRFDPELLREKLLEALDECRVTGARGDGNPYRWDREELAALLAPVLAGKLGEGAMSCRDRIPASRSADFVRGFTTAEYEFLQYESDETHEFVNPFPEGTDEHRGYDDAVYIFLCK